MMMHCGLTLDHFGEAVLRQTGKFLMNSRVHVACLCRAVVRRFGPDMQVECQRAYAVRYRRVFAYNSIIVGAACAACGYG
jgi:hypothetical protein